ncbi:MAG TPA: hypothetical protein VF060_00555 [Trebonia sp.]
MKPAHAVASTQQSVPLASQSDERSTIQRIPARWLWLGGYAVAAVLLFFCYLRISGTQEVTSDGASNALQAWDMLHGNWLLHGWSLTDVSFYTTELPEYILVEMFRGLGPADVHVSAAITYTLLVILAGLLAKGGKTGREGLIRVLIASGIMIAPQIGGGALLLVLSPDHTGTGVPLLLIFLVLDRAPRRWWVPVLVSLMLVWVQVGDRLALTIGVLPIMVVYALRAYQGIVMRREPLRARRFELWLVVLSLASAIAADLIVKVIRHLGGYVTEPLQTIFAPSALWPAHSALTAEGLLGMYGADFAGARLGVLTGLAVLHLAGFGLAAWAFGRAIRHFFALEDVIAQVLTVAIVVNVAAYVFSQLPDTNTYWDNREIASVLAFGAVLAGRLLAGQLERVRLLPALGAVGCCYLLALGYYVTRPQRPAHDQDLASWLTAHHLTTGLGSYAEGNSLILDSGGKLQVSAPATWRGSVHPGTHEAKASDFDPRLHDADFVVTTRQDGYGFFIPSDRVIADFGKPAHTYHFESWTIMVWNKNLLADLAR